MQRSVLPGFRLGIRKYAMLTWGGGEHTHTQKHKRNNNDPLRTLKLECTPKKTVPAPGQFYFCSTSLFSDMTPAVTLAVIMVGA